MENNSGRQLPLALATVAFAGALASSEAAAQAFNDAWEFRLGGGLISRSTYPGSDETKVEAVPLIHATYGRYYIGGVPGADAPFGIGAFLFQDSRWRMGIAAGGGFRQQRKESDDSRLSGLGDIDATIRGSLFASYSYDWLTVRGSVSTDIGGNDQGTLASLGLEGRYRPNARLTLTAGPGITWASDEYTQTFFGIDSSQSIRSGRPEYRASSGVNQIRFSVGADYRLTERWDASVRLSTGLLRGSAADSPITADKSTNTFGAFATYRF